MAVTARIESLASHLVLSYGWRRSFAAFLAGAASTLSMPPFGLFPILFLTLPVLVWLTDATASEPSRPRGLWQAFRTGWWFGFGYLLAGLWWIGNALLIDADQFAWMLPLAVIVLPAALALFYGVGVMAARMLWTDDWRRLLALGGGLAIAEYLRGTVLTGFPWISLGYAALTHPVTMQKASIFGVYGVTALAVPVFATGSLLGPSPSGRRQRPALALAVCLLAIGADAGYGLWRLHRSPERNVPDVTIRLVQPNIRQGDKWDGSLEGEIFGTMMALSRGREPEGGEAAGGLDGIDLVIWPESAFPFILTERSDALAALGDLLPEGTALVAGAVRLEPPPPGSDKGKAFNSVYLIDANGVIEGAADKVHLVPFGEYFPFSSLVERYGIRQLAHLQGGFAAGGQRRPLDTGAGKALPLVCYEIIFSGGITDGDRPDWLLNITNDSWFGTTPGPYQHWLQAVVRGVEEGLPVVRVANSGISSTTDANGRTIRRLDLGERGFVDSPLPAAGPATPFSRYGNLALAIICFAYAGIILFPTRQDHTTRH